MKEWMISWDLKDILKKRMMQESWFIIWLLSSVSWVLSLFLCIILFIKEGWLLQVIFDQSTAFVIPNDDAKPLAYLDKHALSLLYSVRFVYKKDKQERMDYYKW